MPTCGSTGLIRRVFWFLSRKTFGVTLVVVPRFMSRLISEREVRLQNVRGDLQT
jgi:hypothetical protein